MITSWSPFPSPQASNRYMRCPRCPWPHRVAASPWNEAGHAFGLPFRKAEDDGAAERLRQLVDENRRLKQMVADQASDIQVLRAVTPCK